MQQHSLSCYQSALDKHTGTRTHTNIQSGTKSNPEGLDLITFWVQQLGEAQLLLRHIKSVLEVVVGIRPLQGVELNQVRSEERRRKGKRRFKP